MLEILAVYCVAHEKHTNWENNLPKLEVVSDVPKLIIFWSYVWEIAIYIISLSFQLNLGGCKL